MRSKKDYQKAWRAKNPELMEKYNEKAKIRAKEWYSRNKERAKAGVKRYREENKEIFSRKSKEYYLQNKDRIRAYFKAWFAQNKERMYAQNKQYRDTHKDQQKEFMRKWSVSNKDRISENGKEWRKINKAKVNVYSMKRKASKLRAIPKWANDFFISEAYDLAQRRSKATGFEWHVDHIVPLQSKLVCGLHVENNLRVIPATDNHKKNNHFWPDMPC